MKTVRVRIHVCVLDDGNWYAVGWPDGEEGMRAWLQDWSDEETYETDLKGHRFWLECDLQIRADVDIDVMQEPNEPPVKKHTKEEIVKALTKVK